MRNGLNELATKERWQIREAGPNSAFKYNVLEYVQGTRNEFKLKCMTTYHYGEVVFNFEDKPLGKGNEVRVVIDKSLAKMEESIVPLET